MSKQHFIDKEEEISNKYLSANGGNMSYGQQAPGTAGGRAVKSVAGYALGFGVLALTLAVPIAIIYIAVKMSQQK